MKCLVFLLEEPSAREMLKSLLPRLLGDIFNNIDVRYIVFEGKQDLEKQIERKVKLWMRPESCFLVMRDQDAGDCESIKMGLQKKINNTGKQTKTLIRIACRELESFYIGDLQAVEKGLNLSGLAVKQESRKFRSPDNLANPSQELYKLTRKSYQKVSGSREIGKYLITNNSNKSHSFNILIEGIKRVVEI